MYRESAHNPDIGEGMYQNPIFSQDVADPAVFRDGDTYYLTGSTGTYYPALAIYYSHDLVNWSFLCYPFPDFVANIWAPDLLKYRDKYYLYFCADGTNFVSVSDHMDRGWSQPIDLKVDHIDPGHCEMDGRRYLFLSGNMLAPLSDNGLRVTGEMRCVCPPAPIPDAWDVEGTYPESPKVIKRGEYYYLIYADGGTGGPATAHMVVCARAESLFGPWQYSPYNPLVHTWSREEKWHAKGHGHMVEDMDGNWWIVYHAYEKGYMNQGRRLLLEPIVFTADGWPVLLGGAQSDMPRRKPRGRVLPRRDTLSDDFGRGLNSAWQMRGSNRFDRIKAGGGALELRATPIKRPGESHPLTVNPGDHAYCAETTIERAEDCEAGMILIYDEEHYSALGWKDGVLTLYRIGVEQLRLAAPGEKLRIRLRNDRNEVVFYYGLDGAPMRKLNYVHNVQSMDGSAYGGFSSLRVGLYAMGEGCARFGGFQYTAMADASRP